MQYRKMIKFLLEIGVELILAKDLLLHCIPGVFFVNGRR